MTPHEILEHMFTRANPDTDSPPPAHVAWVVYANGTVFYTFPNDDLAVDADGKTLIGAANAAFDELGPVQAGTPSADFAPHRLASWFPNDLVYFVGFDHPSIATVLVTEGEDDLAAGLGGRQLRQADFEQRKVVVTRRFDGTVEHG